MSNRQSHEALTQLDLRCRLTAEAAKGYHKSGFTVIAQDNYYGEMLPRFLELLDPEPVRIVVLCPDAVRIFIAIKSENHILIKHFGKSANV